LASRGRRGISPSSIQNDAEWWALAQHNGLYTPLLDWTQSPFVALFFAFEQESGSESTHRAVWALARVDEPNEKIRKAYKGAGTPPTLERIYPTLDENSRLVNQAGLFTQLPLGKTVESWIEVHLKGKTKHPGLIKILIPEADRETCLRALNRMNINHLSLFPDLYGASQYCNNALSISRYSA
jgi:hypothetical protein